jgi:hypothetical protein
MTEHRKHPRAQISSPVTFQLGDGPRVEARCVDISLGGMFIETDAPASYGTALTIFVRLPGYDATIDAIVRWAKPSGMGVQFGRMGARETHALTELLMQR